MSTELHYKLLLSDQEIGSPSLQLLKSLKKTSDYAAQIRTLTIGDPLEISTYFTFHLALDPDNKKF